MNFRLTRLTSHANTLSVMALAIGMTACATSANAQYYTDGLGIQYGDGGRAVGGFTGTANPGGVVAVGRDGNPGAPPSVSATGQIEARQPGLTAPVSRAGVTPGIATESYARQEQQIHQSNVQGARGALYSARSGTDPVYANGSRGNEGAGYGRGYTSTGQGRGTGLSDAGGAQGGAGGGLIRQPTGAASNGSNANGGNRRTSLMDDFHNNQRVNTYQRTTTTTTTRSSLMDSFNRNRSQTTGAGRGWSAGNGSGHGWGAGNGAGHGWGTGSGWGTRGSYGGASGWRTTGGYGGYSGAARGSFGGGFGGMRGGGGFGGHGFGGHR